MADIRLEVKSAFTGVSLPVTHGDATLSECGYPGVVSVAPLKGQHMGASKAVRNVTGLDLPKTGAAVWNARAGVVWSGMGQWFALLESAEQNSELLGSLSGIAAATDQSDGWAVMRLTGGSAVQVMARLCPLDVENMQTGQSVRTQLGHMMALVLPLEDGFEIWVMRSFSNWAVRHIAEEMKSVEGIRALSD